MLRFAAGCTARLLARAEAQAVDVVVPWGEPPDSPPRFAGWPVSTPPNAPASNTGIFIPIRYAIASPLICSKLEQTSVPSRSCCRAQPQVDPYLGPALAAEPSLIMPGIIISFIFSKQQRLVFQTTPLQNQFACPEEPVDNASNWLGVQISAENFPRSTGSCLFVLQ